MSSCRVFPGPGRSAVMNSATGAASTSELSGPMSLAKIGSSAAAKRLVGKRKKLNWLPLLYSVLAERHFPNRIRTGVAVAKEGTLQLRVARSPDRIIATYFKAADRCNPDASPELMTESRCLLPILIKTKISAINSKNAGFRW